MSGLFPENEVVIFDGYVSDDFVNGMLAGLSKAANLSDSRFYSQAPAIIGQIRHARFDLKSFLTHANFVSSLAKLRTVYHDISIGNFADAQTALNELKGLGSISIVPDFGIALRSTSEKFTVSVTIPRDEQNPRPRTERIDVFLRGYAGPRPTDAQDMRLIAWTDFLTNGPERRFRTDLLEAEINVGLRKFDEAIRLYDGLLEVTPPSSPRHKFLAIRSAFASQGQGDKQFRKRGASSDQQRLEINEKYDSSVSLLQKKEVSPDNPRRQEVEIYAGHQKALLALQLNPLGLWDAFVPAQKSSALEKAALDQITDAEKSAEGFKNFLQNAEQEFTNQSQLQFQIDQESANLEILAKRGTNATLGVSKIAEQLEIIEEQQEALISDALVGGLKAVVEGAGKGFLKGGLGGGAAIAGVGLLGAGLNALDQSQILGHQKHMANIEKDIAENEVEIAQIESQMSDHRLKFYEEMLTFHSNKSFNANLLYALAELNEKRAERQLDVAIYLAYLYERAVAFFLGKPNIRHIRFDYLDQLAAGLGNRSGALLEAHKVLNEDLRKVQQEFTNIQQERIDDFIETVSLRELYPIQFNRFLQTGEMDFVYSLYQLSKRRPATHQCRLHDVGVEVIGLLVAANGFSGTLTHFGRFEVRDKEATLDPGVTRLVPTDEQFAQALEEQRRLGLPVATVGGVLYYNLPPIAKELSLETQFVSRPAEGFTLKIFEGLAPTGMWHLEIREHGKLAISDIILHFSIVSRASDSLKLEPKVDALVRSYENEMAGGDLLDKTSAFSLENEFPDTFLSLQNGKADMVLAEENFQNGLTNLQFKMVIAQAVDQNDKGISGIGLEISRPDAAFTQTRETGVDGFSEDLDASPQPLPRDQRFPLLGAWQIRLTDPAQFNQLGDLRLFFMYAFEEL